MGRFRTPIWSHETPTQQLTLSDSPASSVDLYSNTKSSPADIQAEGIQPSGAPVLLTITLSNGDSMDHFTGPKGRALPSPKAEERGPSYCVWIVPPFQAEQ